MNALSVAVDDAALRYSTIMIPAACAGGVSRRSQKKVKRPPKRWRSPSRAGAFARVAYIHTVFLRTVTSSTDAFCICRDEYKSSTFGTRVGSPTSPCWNPAVRAYRCHDAACWCVTSDLGGLMWGDCAVRAAADGPWRTSDSCVADCRGCGSTRRAAVRRCRLLRHRHPSRRCAQRELRHQWSVSVGGPASHRPGAFRDYRSSC